VANRLVYGEAPTREQIEFIAAHLRQPDRDEMEAMHGKCDVAGLLWHGVQMSSLCWLASKPDGEPVAVFGVAAMSLLSGKGAPWCVGTSHLDRCPGALVAAPPAYIDRMRAEFPDMHNYVDARNTRSIRWLRRMGFAIEDARPMGVAGLPFHRFTMKG